MDVPPPEDLAARASYFWMALRNRAVREGYNPCSVDGGGPGGRRVVYDFPAGAVTIDSSEGSSALLSIIYDDGKEKHFGMYFGGHLTHRDGEELERLTGLVREADVRPRPERPLMSTAR